MRPFWVMRIIIKRVSCTRKETTAIRVWGKEMGELATKDRLLAAP